VDVFNLHGDPAWDAEQERDGYRHRVVAVGRRLGAQLLGGSLYELDPGETTWPYHYELGCEEWLSVVSGRPTLRSPGGEQELAEGDVVVFPEGPAGAHQVSNRSDTTCRILILSSKAPVAVAHFPDSGKVGIWTEGARKLELYQSEPNPDYWDGEA
jgi:uncharacterized cupin superfamily protein